MSHRLFSGMAKHTQKMRALLPVDFFLTVQGDNAIMIVFSSRQAIAPSEVRSFRGRIFYRLRRSDHQCGVQQGSELITAERDHHSDREHRGEAAAGAGEFHGETSFRSFWRAGPGSNRPPEALAVHRRTSAAHKARTQKPSVRASRPPRQEIRSGAAGSACPAAEQPTRPGLPGGRVVEVPVRSCSTASRVVMPCRNCTGAASEVKAEPLLTGAAYKTRR